MLDVDNRTCIDCENGYYGIECSEKCKCELENTDTCDNVSGNCTCRNGWRGMDCSEDIDECLGFANNSICPNNSNCTNLNGTYLCTCDEGFSMSGNRCIACSSTTFGQNCGGQCTCNVSNTRSCDKRNGTCYCSDGWQGVNCTDDVLECNATSNICGNNSVCNETVGSYKCVCNTGYTKSSEGYCENIDECKTGQPNCSMNAKCTDVDGSFNCSCRLGFIGDGHNCTDINDCNPEPCQNNGTCTDLVNGYQCGCVEGFNGTNCENNIDECASQPCHNNGTCKDLINDYTCTCTDGFNGRNCTNNIDECKPLPCQNNGTCTDLVNDYQCDCVAGFNGLNCENNIDECASQPCQNNGTCTDLINDYQCNCTDGFNGTNCESACNNDTYGYQCSNLCACDQENTLDCDYVTGNCVCREHWNGNNCSTHVDDCLKGSAKCDPNTQRCAKRNGTESYFCVCLYGKNSTANGTCLSPLPTHEKNNSKLIMGLGIGIPLLLALLAIAIIVYWKRNAGKNNRDDNSDNDRSPEGSEIFRSRLPVRYGGWGPIYSPWGPKSDYKYESSYLGPAQNTQDGWYQEDSIPEDKRTDEFSWDFMRSMTPKDLTFEIKRPVADSIPNPIYTSIQSCIDDATV